MFALVGGVLIVVGVAAAVSTGRPEHRRRRGLAAVAGTVVLGCAVAPRAAELSPRPEVLVEIELQQPDAGGPVSEPKPVKLPPPPVDPKSKPEPEPKTEPTKPEPKTEPKPEPKPEPPKPEPKPEPPKPKPAPAPPTPPPEKPSAKKPPASPTVKPAPVPAAKRVPPPAKKADPPPPVPSPPAALATKGKLDVAQLAAAAAERVRRRGGHNEGVRITLVWNNTDDVDLILDLEDGTTLRGGTPASKCGGVIELDANLGEHNATDRPVEHAIWPVGKRPDGRVTITARLWKGRNECEEGTRYYVIVHDEQSWFPRVHTGVLKVDREQQVVDVLRFPK